MGSGLRRTLAVSVESGSRRGRAPFLHLWPISTAGGVMGDRPPTWADALARRFHEEYERLAPEFGYQTRQESAVPWSEVPTANKDLMRAVVAEVFYEADPFDKGGHGRGCWMQSGGPCDCTASDGEHFRVRRRNNPIRLHDCGRFHRPSEACPRDSGQQITTGSARDNDSEATP